MKKNIYLSIALMAIAVACSTSSGNHSDSDIEAKKKELEESQKEMASLMEKIASLEKEISEADPSYARQNSKAILVSTFLAEKKLFEHRVDIRGAVESRKNVMLSAQTAGEIQQVHVREGQRISKGQVLVSLNADVIRNSIAELKTSLELANSVYEKQAKLWEQKIGTELQYLQAKNNKESLERKLATANAQLDQSIIKAPFSGTVDQLPAKVGEMASPGIPLVRVVSQEDMYIKADASERFIGKFNAGDPVEVYFPTFDKRITSKISSVGQVINPENRTFTVEVALPRVDFVIKPNQVTVLGLRDYISEETFAVPTRIVQRDDEGQYIYIVDNRGKKSLARKLRIKTGVNSLTQTEILTGLQGNEQIVDQGFRDLSDGVEVEVANDSTNKD